MYQQSHISTANVLTYLCLVELVVGEQDLVAPVHHVCLRQTRCQAHNQIIKRLVAAATALVTTLALAAAAGEGVIAHRQPLITIQSPHWHYGTLRATITVIQRTQ